jgi:hypothetical protein
MHHDARTEAGDGELGDYTSPFERQERYGQPIPPPLTRLASPLVYDEFEDPHRTVDTGGSRADAPAGSAAAPTLAPGAGAQHEPDPRCSQAAPSSADAPRNVPRDV